MRILRRITERESSINLSVVLSSLLVAHLGCGCMHVSMCLYMFNYTSRACLSLFFTLHAVLMVHTLKTCLVSRADHKEFTTYLIGNGRGVCQLDVIYMQPKRPKRHRGLHTGPENIAISACVCLFCVWSPKDDCISDDIVSGMCIRVRLMAAFSCGTFSFGA